MAPRMNEELSKIGEKPLAIPVGYSKCTKQGEEAYLMTDLRSFEENGEMKSFKMFNRKECMDIEYALLVVKELARFHATSLVLENRIKKSFTEEYPYFDVRLRFSHCMFCILTFLSS